MEIIELRDGLVRLPRRKPDTHKGDYGRLLILGGCVGYTGAPTLCARAAVRAGAGLVYLGVPAPIYEITAVKNDEAMPFPLPADPLGRVAPSAAEQAAARMENCDVCAVGPGMGRCDGTTELVKLALERFPGPVVLDADALNVLPELFPLLRARTALTVLTPHAGEFARLGGVLTGDSAADALRFSEAYGCVTVLKGSRSVAAWPDGTVYISTHGNPGMAKGGSGDVLTGVLAAMLGQLPARAAVAAGLHLHSLAGDLCRDRLGEYAMTATDLIKTLPAASMLMLED